MIYRDYLIIGAGVAAANACQSLREYDPKGSVLLAGYENLLPYDRPSLSKKFLTQAKPNETKLLHLSPSWYQNHKIETRLGTLVTQLNIERRLAVLVNGQTIEFKKALLATGSRALRPRVAGANLGNIICLRSVRDAHALRETAQATERMIIIGGDTIAVEAAVALASAKKGVTLMCPDQYIWQQRVDLETAKWLTKEIAAMGVELMMQETLNGFEGKTVLKNIQTKSGKRFAASCALLALGSEPNLQLVQNTPLSSPNGAPVSELLETEEKGIYAAGDIALYPDKIFGGVRRVENHENAMQQGRIAGANITGRKRQRYLELPYFWSEIGKRRFEFYGDFSQPPQNVELDGERERGAFSVRYMLGDKLQGILLCNPKPADSKAAREAFPRPK